MKKILLSLALAAAFMMSLAGCVEEEGPLEKAGEAVDEAVEEAGDKIEDATDS